MCVQCALVTHNNYKFVEPADGSPVQLVQPLLVLLPHVLELAVGLPELVKHHRFVDVVFFVFFFRCRRSLDACSSASSSACNATIPCAIEALLATLANGFVKLCD